MVLLEQSGLPAGLEVHQLLVGREIGVDPRGDPVKAMVFQFAGQMANYTYLITDRSTGSAVAVDPCWDVAGILEIASTLNVRIASAIFTHRHFDHTGGNVPPQMTGGRPVCLEGLHTMLEHGVEVAMGVDDVEATAAQSGVPPGQIRPLTDGDAIPVGGGQVSVIHTPGHTPGSVCFHLRAPGCPGVLFSGDTLFIGSCGRSDLPESDPALLMSSLARISQLPDGVVVLPGHNYAAPAHSTIATERATNGIMLQALSRGGAVAPLPADTSRAVQLALPDYLGVCRKIFAHHQEHGIPHDCYSEVKSFFNPIGPRL